MTAAATSAAEDLVQVYHARDDWESTLLTGFLNDEGVPAMWREQPTVPPFDWYEFFNCNRAIDGIFVFQHDAVRARQLIAEYQAAPPDEAFEEIAARKSHPDHDQIHGLREALREERGTFRFLRWMMLWAFVAGWLWLGAPLPDAPLGILVALAIVAFFVGSWLRRKL